MTIPGPIATAATHGAWCPKMCTFACPVTEATGRDDAVPWSFHRTVVDLDAGVLPVATSVAARLEACTGCLACQVPCVFDQDVPTQVRAGRAALFAGGVIPLAVAAAVERAAAGGSPDGTPRPELPAADDTPTVTLVVGCRDDVMTVTAAVRLLRAAGERVAARQPDGCCGALLEDLGADDAAAAARAGVSPQDRTTMIALDPHCLPALRAAGHDACDVVSHLDAHRATGRLPLGGPPARVTWHDPCLLARREGVLEAPRRLLAAAGYEVVEPEHTGQHTACSGAGMGLPLLAPEAAAATAEQRVARLPDLPILTACAGARRQLAAAGGDVGDLLTALADRLEPR